MPVPVFQHTVRMARVFRSAHDSGSASARRAGTFCGALNRVLLYQTSQLRSADVSRISASPPRAEKGTGTVNGASPRFLPSRGSGLSGMTAADDCGGGDRVFGNGASCDCATPIQESVLPALILKNSTACHRPAHNGRSIYTLFNKIGGTSRGDDFAHPVPLTAVTLPEAREIGTKWKQTRRDWIACVACRWSSTSP